MKPFHLVFVVEDQSFFLFNFVKFVLVLHPQNPLFLFQCVSELRGVFNFLSTDQNLGVHLLDLLFQILLLLLGGVQVFIMGLKRFDCCFLVLFGPLAFLLKFRNVLLVITSVSSDCLVSFEELLFQLFQFDLILAKKGSLVSVFVDVGFVLDMLGASRKL